MVKCRFDMGYIHLIFASDKRGCIGVNGTLPFRLKEDMSFFKKMTTNNVVVMGRKTYESLGNNKPLPNRENIVLSRDEVFSKKCKCEVINSLDGEFLRRLKNDSRDIFIIGGADVYKQFLPHCDSIYMTLVDTVVENGDTFFGLKEIYEESRTKNWKIQPIKHNSKRDQNNEFGFFIFNLHKPENQNIARF